MASTDHQQTGLSVSLARPPLGRRRVARRVPARSPQGVVLGVLRAALRPSWTLADASRAVLVDIDDPVILRGATARLRSSAEGRTTLFQARALATLELAISLLDRHDELAEPGVGVRRNGGSSR